MRLCVKNAAHSSILNKTSLVTLANAKKRAFGKERKETERNTHWRSFLPEKSNSNLRQSQTKWRVRLDRVGRSGAASPFSCSMSLQYFSGDWTHQSSLRVLTQPTWKITVQWGHQTSCQSDVLTFSCIDPLVHRSLPLEVRIRLWSESSCKNNLKRSDSKVVFFCNVPQEYADKRKESQWEAWKDFVLNILLPAEMHSMQITQELMQYPSPWNGFQMLSSIILWWISEQILIQDQTLSTATC